MYEKTSAAATGAAGIGLPGLMWALDHTGWIIPTGLYMTVGVISAALILLSLGLWGHILFNWARGREKRGLSSIAQPNPEITLKEVVQRIRGASPIPDPQSPESVKWLETLEMIREKALHGTITVFGYGMLEWRSTKPIHWYMLPRHKIEPSYWANHHIDYQEFASDGLGLPIELGSSGQVEQYIGLWFDRRQVDELWPLPRRRINWRSPITWTLQEK